MDNELYHHGVKGQKWGVRRYQNADGTLTAAGRKRQERANAKEFERRIKESDPSVVKVKSKKNANGDYDVVLYKKVDKTHNWSDDAKTAHDIKRKNVKQMSNAELKKLNERTRLEQEYSRLNPNTVQKGWKYAVAGAAALGTVAGIYNNSQTLIKAGKKIAERFAG